MRYAVRAPVSNRLLVFCRMETVSQALEELLVAAQRQDCLTVGVYESAKLMNV